MRKPLRQLGILLAVAAAYWLSARLGKLLTTPPIYATAVWPPAGIALGAMLVWGRWVLPGIWLGAWLGNLEINGTEPIRWVDVLLPAGIALGAAAQAAIVARWIRGPAGGSPALSDDKSIIRFLLLAGPAGCCINATFGSGLLLLAGRASWGSLLSDWWTWWVGDTIGALIFAPLVLIAFAQPRPLWASRRRTVALPLLCCLALVMVLFAYMRSQESYRKRSEFMQLADTAMLSLESRLRGDAATVKALKGLFDASSQVDCGEFKVFADTLLGHKASVQALEWAVPVSQDGRGRFEQSGQPCGSGGFRITEQDTEGRLVEAAQREAYLPVVYAEPLASNLSVLGFDLSSESLRRAAVVQARDSGELALTAPLTLVQEMAGQQGVLMVAPLYRKGGDLDSPQGRQQGFAGVVLGALRLGDVVDAVLAGLGKQRALLRLRVVDETAVPSGGVLYADPGFMADSPLFFQHQISFGGRQWRVSMSATEADFGRASSVWVWYVLAGGMLFSGLLEGFLLLLTGRAVHMEALVAERTLDLADSNRQLQEEVDERARTEVALRESESRFRTLANAAPVLIWLAGTDQRCHWFNQVWLDFTGKTLEQEQGEGWLAGMHPDDARRCMEVYASHFGRRQPFHMEYRLRRHDGEYRWVVDTGVPLVDEGGEFVGYIGSCLDVTERKLIEQEAARLALVAEKTTSAIIITDAAGLVEWVNPAFTLMTGYTLAEVAGHEPGAFLQGPDTDPLVVEHMVNCLHQQQGFDVEILNYRKDLTPFWLHLIVDPVFDGEGRLTHFIGVETDITERKAAEQTMRQAKLAADKANQAKSEFLANMSHEIRTPMNGVLGMLELLRGTELNAEQRELADVASHSAEALMEIINDILDFSKIEAGKLKLDRVDFNVRELCEMVCLLMAVQAQAKGLELTCFVHPDLYAEVWGDATRLRQVLVNLIGNAVKFTLQGEVSVEVAGVAEDCRSVAMRFSVKDTGIGIRAEALARLFMPFEQAEQGDTRRFGGTGLGLAICKSLVQMMGGEIGVESVPNAGTTFWFTIRLEKAGTVGWQPDTVQLAGRRVLVADDNRTSRGILERFLENWGAVAQAAEDGQQALDLFVAAWERGEPFDVAVLDLSMPSLGGVEVSRAIASHPHAQPVPCIVLVPAGVPAESLRKEVGVWLALGKPVRQSQLFDALVDALHGGVPRRVAEERKERPMLPQFTGRRILLVEDNPINQRVALKMLGYFGVDICVAGDGMEALRRLEAGSFDLVLMDCQIPEMDGYAVTKRLRERELALGLPRMPVLALTANAITGDREKSLASGMDEHLTKPLALADLTRALLRWLPTAESAAPALQEGRDRASLPVWDRQAALDRLCGDADLLEELKALFISEAPRHMEWLASGELPDGEATPTMAIACLAHTLKGMASHFSAQAVVDRCAQIEAKARAGDISLADPLIRELQADVGRLIGALRGVSADASKSG